MERFAQHWKIQPVGAQIENVISTTSTGGEFRCWASPTAEAEGREINQCNHVLDGNACAMARERETRFAVKALLVALWTSPSARETTTGEIASLSTGAPGL